MSTPIRSTYHHGQLRPALIAEARALLDAGGPEAVGLRETARRVGVSATATYRHFRDKDDLLAAVAAEGFREFGQYMAAATSATPAPFAAMGRAYIAFARENPGLFRLMFSPLIRERDKFPELAVASDAAFSALRAGAEAFRSSPDDNVEVIAVGAWAQVHGLSHLLLDRVIPEEDAESLIAALLPLTPPPSRR